MQSIVGVGREAMGDDEVEEEILSFFIFFIPRLFVLGRLWTGWNGLPIWVETMRS